MIYNCIQSLRDRRFKVVYAQYMYQPFSVAAMKYYDKRGCPQTENTQLCPLFEK